MKKIMKLLILMIVSTNAFAMPGFECEMDDRGDVNISYIYSKEIPQKLSVWLGRESWSRPFAIRTACEHLIYEIINTPKESWGTYHCQNYEVAEAEKYISFPLSDKGLDIIQNQILFKNWEDLTFRPERPVHPFFLDTRSDEACDPY